MARKSDVDRDGKDTAVLDAVTKMLEARIPNMSDALKTPGMSKHLRGHRYLDVGTSERASWQAGYVAAMKDALRMIKQREKVYPLEMTGTSPS